MCIHICIYIHTHLLAGVLYINIHIYMYNVLIYINIYIYVYIYIHTHTHIYVEGQVERSLVATDVCDMQFMYV